MRFQSCVMVLLFAIILIVAHGVEAVEWDDGRNCKAFSKC